MYLFTAELTERVFQSPHCEAEPRTHALRRHSAPWPSCSNHSTTAPRIGNVTEKKTFIIFCDANLIIRKGNIKIIVKKKETAIQSLVLKGKK